MCSLPNAVEKGNAYCGYNLSEKKHIFGACCILNCIVILCCSYIHDTFPCVVCTTGVYSGFFREGEGVMIL